MTKRTAAAEHERSDVMAQRDVTTEARSAEQLTVAVTGATGVVGRRLTAALEQAGHTVVRLRRPSDGKKRKALSATTRMRHAVRADRSGKESQPANSREWQPENPDPKLLEGVDAVVHLAGEPLARRFSRKHQRAIHNSRVTPTQKLAELVAQTPGCEVLVTASAVGYYGYDAHAPVTEQSPRGRGFLAGVCAAWEKACAPATAAGKRTVHIRTGLVLDGSGGILKILATLTKLGVNGPLGDGRQFFAWIGAADLVRIYREAVENPDYHGPINAVGPQRLTNREFTAVLAKVLRRPAIIRVPRIAAALIFGKVGARELALASQNVIPQKLQQQRYEFSHKTAAAAIRAELRGQKAELQG